MADVYKKVGRGGAGNFYSQKDAEDVAKANNDLEAQNSSQTNDLPRTISASKSPPEYQHTGRGGAGNWVQSSELNAKGLKQVDSPDATLPTNSNANAVTKRVLGASKPNYRGGRGGAGNYSEFAAEEQAKKGDEERMKRETEERITRDVEAGLSRPPKGYGGRGGAFEMV